MHVCRASSCWCPKRDLSVACDVVQRLEHELLEPTQVFHQPCHHTGINCKNNEGQERGSSWDRSAVESLKQTSKQRTINGIEVTISSAYGQWIDGPIAGHHNYWLCAVWCIKKLLQLDSAWGSGHTVHDWSVTTIHSSIQWLVYDRENERIHTAWEDI